MDFKDVMKMRDSVYTKKKYIGDIESWGIIALFKWLGHDENNIEWIAKNIEYQYYINPVHSYILLYFGIQKVVRVPTIHFPKKSKEIEDDLRDRICEVLDWSIREFELNRYVIEKEILSNESYWRTKLGLKDADI